MQTIGRDIAGFVAGLRITNRKTRPFVHVAIAIGLVAFVAGCASRGSRPRAGWQADENEGPIPPPQPPQSQDVVEEYAIFQATSVVDGADLVIGLRVADRCFRRRPGTWRDFPPAPWDATFDEPAQACNERPADGLAVCVRFQPRTPEGEAARAPCQGPGSGAETTDANGVARFSAAAVAAHLPPSDPDALWTNDEPYTPWGEEPALLLLITTAEYAAHLGTASLERIAELHGDWPNSVPTGFHPGPVSGAWPELYKIGPNSFHKGACGQRLLEESERVMKAALPPIHKCYDDALAGRLGGGGQTRRDVDIFPVENGLEQRRKYLKAGTVRLSLWIRQVAAGSTAPAGTNALDAGVVHGAQFGVQESGPVKTRIVQGELRRVGPEGAGDDARDFLDSAGESGLVSCVLRLIRNLKLPAPDQKECAVEQRVYFHYPRRLTPAANVNGRLHLVALPEDFEAPLEIAADRLCLLRLARQQANAVADLLEHFERSTVYLDELVGQVEKVDAISVEIREYLLLRRSGAAYLNLNSNSDLARTVGLADSAAIRRLQPVRRLIRRGPTE